MLAAGQSKQLNDLNVHCLLQSVNELDLPLCQTLFDHHEQSGSIRRSEACREQTSPWTQAHQAQVVIGKLKGEKGRGSGVTYYMKIDKTDQLYVAVM